jgi:hypothetical protein
MKFGINILNFWPGANPESLERLARFAEDTGYHFGARSADAGMCAKDALPPNEFSFVCISDYSQI